MKREEGTPIRIGLAGLGRAGWGMHVEELKGREDRFRITAAFDPIPERRKKAQELGIRAYASLEELVRDPEVELIDIATRSSDHYAHGMLALEAGKDIYVEKPLTHTHAEAVQLFDTAEKAGRRIFVRHNRRFDPDFLHVREVIASGVLGEVFQIRLCRHNYQRRNDWQTLKEFGGGQLLNWGPHIVDHALQLLESPVVSLWSDLKRVAAAGDAEDHLKIVMKGKNGRVVDLEISGGIPVASPTYLVHGTKGSLAVTGQTIQLKYLDPEAELVPIQADPGTPGASFGSTGTFQSGEALPWFEQTLPVGPSRLTDIWEVLYAAYRLGQPFPIQAAEALEVMRIIDEVKKGTAFA